MRYSFAVLAAVAAVVRASPVPQAVTAAISPSAAAPPGCLPTFAGTFGVAVLNISTSATTPAKAKRQAPQSPDGQPVAASVTAVPVSQISDAQPQAPTITAAPVSQISDHQIQAPTGVTVAAVSMITDGQIQGGMHTVVMMPVSQIKDGQVQQPTVYLAPVTAISDGQPQAPKITVAPISQISDHQIQATTGTASAASQLSEGQPQAPTGTSSGAPTPSSSGTVLVACASNSTLSLTLSNGILKDAKGRTGYIASNYQFQFDSPPQAGAIYTSGFSVCGNGSLALGGSNVFYQCLSGNFYNLYDRHWAPQCSPVTINALHLQNCTSS